MTRAVLYLRLSDSTEASTSIQRQEADLRARADREGWDVVEVLVDDGISGGISRAKADRALEMLRTGEADVLAVWKSDRWSRQGLRAVADLDEVLAARPEARFVGDQDGLDSREASFGIMSGMLAVVANAERKNISLRVRSSIATLRAAGRFAGGNLPYGYRPVDNPDGPGRVLVINDEEAAVVREAAERVLHGTSTYAVTRDLNSRGVPTRRGEPWTTTALLRMLTRDHIVGRVTHHGELLRGEDGLPLEVWPPVLDVATWLRLRSTLGVGVPRTRKPNRRRAVLLSGIAKCGCCGGPLYFKVNGAGSPSYYCGARSNGRQCDGVSIDAPFLDEYVSSRMLASVGDADVMEEQVEAGADDAALAEIDRAMKEMAGAMTAPGADRPALMARLDSLDARRASLKAAPSEPTVTLTPTGQTYREAWDAADMEGRRAILDAVIGRVTVQKGRRGERPNGSRVSSFNRPAYVAGTYVGAKPRLAVALNHPDV